jgi:hypothetical protein
MKWVMVLTVVLLYVGAIVFTNLVGQGIIYGGAEQVPDTALLHFGSTSRSMFSLFKLMNDDQSVVDSIVDSFYGKFLFALFMVASNWMVLAVLTSVVSDHMISASAKGTAEDEKKDTDAEVVARARRFRKALSECDTGAGGTIELQAFEQLLEDPGTCNELCVAANTSKTDLMDLYYILCDSHFRIRYEDFVDEVQACSDAADKRSLYRIVAYIRDMEQRIEKRQVKMLGLLGLKEETMKEEQLRKCTVKDITSSHGISRAYEDVFPSCSPNDFSRQATPESPMHPRATV